MLFNPRNRHLYLMLAAEALCFAAALSSSYLLRFEFSLPEFYAAQLKSMLAWVLPLKLCVFLALGLYRGMWRYTSLADFKRLAEAVLLSSALLVACVAYVYGFAGFSRAVLAVDGLLTLLLTGALRLGIRVLYASAHGKTSAPGPARRVLVIGAGGLGERLLREISQTPALNLHVIGFLDDDPDKLGRSLHGREVLGRVDQLPRIAAESRAEEIVIAVSHASAGQMRRIVEACKASGLPHRILPATSQLLDGKARLTLRPVDYQDLLGRSEVELDQRGLAAILTDKVVLVTGCGGSIGSELCRQVARFAPARLVLVDASEYNLYAIAQELAQSGFANFSCVLGSVADAALMDAVLAEHSPSLLLHAAAYKHVPMLEENPWSAVTNNVSGARVLMAAAIKHGVERFVTVSTDKAVNPASVMGASKRVTEKLMACHAGGPTRFSAVRFGNVVGSSGSVVPLFRSQIEAGGPVTVTHPDMTRYFMSISEACQLILQAAAMDLAPSASGGGGEIFVLRMGEPVRIVDLARDLIRLSGREPGVDCDIVFTGLRPGEKLAEELMGAGEEVLGTGHEKIMVLRGQGDGRDSDALDATVLDAALLDELQAAATRRDAAAIRALLQRLIPEYAPEREPQ
ncbi:MAG TPA: nucleoside-diphosphate sugar epimerase/dehydratase [Humidesulfovibrio sp.]|uniref:polysaccharide biosynthesis protein n=1 Tax=Humidesulfovibrio sp. TaxID=2910988 RepID=UPI002CC0C10D|nr:nucleoside-diphosphate sugar epimerase/dehydratase [Humidesulfovibrio sp.]HWR04065.1 nucleoside-diphosphate sugar epimerase/dehydratase [Humidesulfovibrio sp.]